MSAVAWDSSGGKQERRFAARRLKDLVTGSPYCPLGRHNGTAQPV